MRPCSLVQRDFKRILTSFFWALTDRRKKLLVYLISLHTLKQNPYGKSLQSVYVSFHALSNPPLEADESVLTSIEAIAGDIDGDT